ncbi:hypothetical protein FH972_021805 [Carpinus fangiana]|uniref:IMP-specific 5'-nucleotidase 1 n=1 Tax=Carpinus fangiana TaxID=176857 RepID=A0A5N6KSH3_9ROSI|nr:hypothetical protein FH972_021805 [Carpinus fangiana]
MAGTAHRRYAEIMFDVEELINDHIRRQQSGTSHHSKLKLLVPSIGTFFTPLPLRDAFVFQDRIRKISSRRFVAPSFNDIRLVLNTAQAMSLENSANGSLQLVTFDGDVTLYDDGESLLYDNPVVPRIIALMQRDVRIGIVTAAGYVEPEKYYGRLFGLLDAVQSSPKLSSQQRNNIIVMGGESNYLLRFDEKSPHRLTVVARKDWALPEMQEWRPEYIEELLDVGEQALRKCVATMDLDAHVIRKGRAVGIIPAAGKKFSREQLEETVLVTQKILEVSEAGKRLPFCAFNGGNDVFVDIGDKSWGVMACQQFFGGIEGNRTLHVGDQFLSAGANDFKARLACTTAWIASPAETVQLLDEIEQLRKEKV